MMYNTSTYTYLYYIYYKFYCPKDGRISQAFPFSKHLKL